MSRILTLLAVAVIATVCHSVNAQKMMVVDREYRADLKVCEVTTPSRADLIVYVTDREYQAAGNEGNWMFVDREYRADFKIFWVDREYRADLKVYFTNNRSQAGWRDTGKKHLLYK